MYIHGISTFSTVFRSFPVITYFLLFFLHVHVRYAKKMNFHLIYESSITSVGLLRDFYCLILERRTSRSIVVS